MPFMLIAPIYGRPATAPALGPPVSVIVTSEKICQFCLARKEKGTLNPNIYTKENATTIQWYNLSIPSL